MLDRTAVIGSVALNTILELSHHVVRSPARHYNRWKEEIYMCGAIELGDRVVSFPKGGGVLDVVVVSRCNNCGSPMGLTESQAFWGPEPAKKPSSESQDPVYSETGWIRQETLQDRSSYWPHFRMFGCAWEAGNANCYVASIPALSYFERSNRIEIDSGLAILAMVLGGRIYIVTRESIPGIDPGNHNRCPVLIPRVEITERCRCSYSSPRPQDLDFRRSESLR